MTSVNFKWNIKINIVIISSSPFFYLFNFLSDKLDTDEISKKPPPMNRKEEELFQ